MKIAGWSRSSSRWMGPRTITMEVAPRDKVRAMMRRIPSGGDVYVTNGGRVPRRSDELRSCGVAVGSAVQVSSKIRGRRKTQGQEEQG